MKEIIKRIRTSASLSQGAFAKEIGVSFATVNRWENDKASPSISAVKRISEFCESKGIHFDIQEIWEETND